MVAKSIGMTAMLAMVALGVVEDSSDESATYGAFGQVLGPDLGHPEDSLPGDSLRGLGHDTTYLVKLVDGAIQPELDGDLAALVSAEMPESWRRVDDLPWADVLVIVSAHKSQLVIDGYETCDIGLHVLRPAVFPAPGDGGQINGRLVAGAYHAGAVEAWSGEAYAVASTTGELIVRVQSGFRMIAAELRTSWEGQMLEGVRDGAWEQ